MNTKGFIVILELSTCNFIAYSELGIIKDLRLSTMTERG